MRVPEHIIDNIRDSTEIVSLVGGYVNLKKRGTNFLGLCPFHNEKTPSFSVSPSKQIWHCFGCNRGGNVFSFVMEYERVNFIDAVRTLAEKAGIEIPESKTFEEGESKSAVLYKVNRAAASEYHKQLTGDDGAEAREYLAGRGIEGEMLKEYGIGLAPNEWEWLKGKLSGRGFDEKLLISAGLLGKSEQGNTYDLFRGRIVFPVINEAGKVVAFGGRVWKEENGGGAKYVNSPESPVYIKGKVLYGLYQTKESVKKTNRILLVEGYTDFLSIVGAGITNAAATSGTALTQQHARLAKRYADSAVLLYDGDEAGRKAAVRAAVQLMGVGFDIRVAQLPDGSDPDSFVRKEGPEKLNELIGSAAGFVDFRIGIIPEVDLSEPALKSREVKRVVEELIDLKDELVKDLLLKEFASKFGVDEELIKRESEKYKSYIRAEDEAGEAIEFKLDGAVQKAEYQLVMLLFSMNDKVYDSTKEFLADYNFSNDHIANLSGLILK
ncbi:MAG: DNA primase [Candidatus Marinimicrobia bacterium]|nr:DNA primase [Candidatus Neomarinimicrobiota bacterium]